jgi:pilus assembly protein CpaE
VCHNTAWSMSEISKTNVVVADLDLAFGTTGLDFNQDPVQGIAEALQSPERLDEVLLDRLLTKCSEHLSIFAAPVVLDRDYEISPDACDLVLDVVRQNVPYVTVDLPHTWTPWVKRVLLQADEIVITAVPDLANLRNAKNLIDLLKQNRANDGPCHIVVNMAKTPKRPEISAKEFSVALDITPTQIIEYDSETFGLAANNGQMIEEFTSKSRAAQQFRELAMALMHRREMKEEKKASPLAQFAPLLEKLKLKR